jgi:ABC-2 type transport system permease protein
MTGYRELVLKDLLEAWRTRRLALVVLLFIGLGVAAPILTKTLPSLIQLFGSTPFATDLPTPGLADVINELLRTTLQFGAVAAILLAMGSIATERERGTAAFVLSKPATRAALIWAKVVSIGIELAIAVGFAVLAAWVYSWVLFHRPSILAWTELAAVIWLGLMVYAAITILGSVLARSALGAAGIGLLALVVVSMLSVVPNFGPWLPSGLSGVALSFALREQSPDLDPVTTITVSIGIVLVAVGLAWLRFRRVEV